MASINRARRRNEEGEWEEIDKWVAVVEAGRNGQGKRKQIKREFDQKRDAERWVHKMEHQKTNGKSMTSPNMTVRELMQEWLEMKESQVGRRSFESYRRWALKHIAPELGGHKLRHVTVDMIDAFYAQKRESGNLRVQDKGLSETSLNHMHVVLKAAFDWGIKKGYCHENPVRKIANPPTPSDQEMQFLNVEQTQTLLEALREEDSIYRWIYACAVLTGLRKGELLGLPLDNLDLENQKLRVEQTLNRSNDDGIYLDTPKTDSSRRTVVLSDRTVSYFEHQLELRDYLKHHPDSHWEGTDLIFTSSNGQPINPSNVQRHYKQFLERAGLPDVPFHALRHSHCALLIHREVDTKIIQRRLGHKHHSTTIDIYGHLLPGRQDEAADALDELLF